MEGPHCTRRRRLGRGGYGYGYGYAAIGVGLIAASCLPTPVQSFAPAFWSATAAIRQPSPRESWAQRRWLPRVGADGSLLLAAAADPDLDAVEEPASPQSQGQQEDDDEEEEEEEDIVMRFFQQLSEEDEREKEKQQQQQPKGPRNYFQDLALMADAAAQMPVDFRSTPELAYYKLGGDMDTCRLITGTWQLDGKHGYHPFFMDVKQAIFDMVRVDGYTTFDVAPFYGQVERWLGEVRAKIEDPQERDAYRIFGKLAFPPLLPTDRIGRAEVEREVDACLTRLRADRLDLLQLHWWDFEDPRYLDVLNHLAELKDKGKIRHVGVTNFDAPALEAALASGLPIVSNSVQYSILDQRPAGELTEVCLRHNVTLLAYGSLLGGFLTERWLGEHPPDPRAFTSASEEKYYQMLRAWGSWEQFQELLSELKAVARKHRSSIAHVALRWVLDRPAVGSVIVGTRLGYVDHLEANKRVLKLELTASDRENIWRAARLGKSLTDVLGGVGVEYQRAVADVPERYVTAEELLMRRKAERRAREGEGEGEGEEEGDRGGRR